MEIPKLIRTLSSHHWEDAEVRMITRSRNQQWAGESGDWIYIIVRDNTKTRDALRKTFYKREMIHEVPTRLPCAKRCENHNKNGKKCGKKTFETLCSVHRP